MSDTHARTVAYVRDTMVPQQAPPISQVGAVRWVRENLFDGWVSTVLTALSVAAVLWLVLHLGPWLSNSIWNAGSLTECRQILDGTSGACWGVIRDRLSQLLFGFYPSHLYWRPITALALLLVALAPILFPWAPKRMLWFSAIYPFVAYFLLWGGSVWLPVLTALALGATIATAILVSARRGVIAGSIAAVVVFAVIFGNPVAALLNLVNAVFGAFSREGQALVLEPQLAGWRLRDLFPLFGHVNRFLDGALPLGNEFVRSDRFGGFLISLTIGVTGISLSLPLGIVLALGRRSDMLLIKTVCVVFIEFIRGVPLITLLFTASLLLNYFLPPGTTFDLILRVIIMVTLFAAAYMAEVIRGGLAALPRGQYEAADALGLDYWKAQRLIIMPQALKISIPGIVNTFIGLFKDTTLVVFIGLLDPIGFSNAIRASSDWQGIYWELFIFIGAVFFIFCFGMSRYSMYLERRLRTDHR